MERRARQVFRSAIAALALMAMSSSAMASLVTVDAKDNSSTGGTGASTGLNSIAGQQFSVTALATDLWSAGLCRRWSNADGLTGQPAYATGDRLAAR